MFRKVENELIEVAAEVGNIPTSKLVSQIKLKIQSSEAPEAVTAMRKTQALRQALVR